ncbi:MAG: glycine--tRNA ligase subunit beta [Halanaerobiaceae bacterium]
MADTAVLEIGTEELPAKKVPGILTNLRKVTEKKLEKNRLNCENIRVMAAPRRLAVLLEELEEYQDDLVEEIRGPARNIAFDEEGKPTKAAEGFARGQGVEVDDLQARETGNGEYMFAVVEHEKKPAYEVLPDIFREMIKDLKLPVTMRWGDYDMDFIRPIHWVLALHNSRTLGFELGPVTSGNTSYGHRFLGSGEFVIESASEYIDKLRENYVLVDPEEREEKIKAGIAGIEKRFSASADLDADLMQEVLYLVEYPTPLAGEFDEKYLQLPEPVLVTPLKEHQRYFPLRGEKGDLLPVFVAVRDGGEEYLDKVREGNEKVIEARLADARFYYRRDQEKTMEERIEGLKGLVFREELGTMYNKIMRVKSFCAYLATEISLPEVKKDNLLRAAHLAKADLASEMVREFSELQGIIGSEYAAEAGEKREICLAIEEHYYPRYAGDRLPETEIARLLALADKLDTLVGCFGIGLIPSGSEDPYGLRRFAMGVVRILKAGEYNLEISQLCQQVYSSYRDTGCELERDVRKTIEELEEFLLGRVEYFLREEQNIEHDVVAAVVGGLPGNVSLLFNSARSCAKIRKSGSFEEMVTAFNRVESITGEREEAEVDQSLFREEVEKELYSASLTVEENILEFGSDYDYSHNFNVLLELVDPVHEFFENVRVMAEDDLVRENRLNLLRRVLGLMSLLGDLTEIKLEG